MMDFCTYFDSRYLPRGLALYASLQKFLPRFRLWVLCLDDATRTALTRLGKPEIRTVTLAEIEAWEPRLAAAKAGRSLIEYYFTLSPFWPRYLLDRLPPGSSGLIYLDADLYFFSSPSAVLAEMETASILICGHRFPPHLSHLDLYGTYNVGLLGFRRDDAARECLGWWADRCLEWCHDRPEGGRFADQKYLDDWPTRFPRVAVLRHPGGGLAPWNVSAATLVERSGTPWITGPEDAPVVFYHFHKLRWLKPWLVDLALDYEPEIPARAAALLYRPYVRALRAACAEIARVVPGYRMPLHSARSGPMRFGAREIVSALWRGKWIAVPPSAITRAAA